MKENQNASWLEKHAPEISDGLAFMQDKTEWTTKDKNPPVWVTILYASRKKVYSTLHQQRSTQKSLQMHDVDHDDSIQSQFETTTRNIRELARRVKIDTKSMDQAVDVICLRVSQLIDSNHKCVFKNALNAKELQRLQAVQYYRPLMMKELMDHFGGFKNTTRALDISDSMGYKLKKATDTSLGNYSNPEMKSHFSKTLLHYLQTYEQLHNIPVDIEPTDPKGLTA